MNQLTTISYEGEKITVSARELHEFLDVGTHFKDWFPRMTEYGFTENHDYTPLIFEHPQNHQLTTDYRITVEMAKEIAMIQRSERGKQARQYFIQLEKAWNTPEAVMSRAIKLADANIEKLKISNARLQMQIEADRSKVLFADAVSGSDNSVLIGQLAKIIKQNGIDIGQKRLFTWLRDNRYLIKSGRDMNMPTQRAMEMGLFEIRKSAIVLAGENEITKATTLVTGKGQIYFVQKFLSEKTLRTAEK